MDKSDKLFLAAIAFSTIAVIGITAYSFVYLKNYDFVTETECDPATETCFYRDCSEEDSCPPNGLENYRVFTMNARDFNTCADNSCLDECISGTILCEELMCGESEEDMCSEAPPIMEETETKTDDESTEEVVSE